jgi:M6 family metalloprotease-like protein
MQKRIHAMFIRKISPLSKKALLIEFKKIILFSSAFFVLYLALPDSIYGVRHISGQMNEYKGPEEHIRARGAQAVSLRKTISPEQGVKKVAVILVNFKSAGVFTSGYHKMTKEDILGLNETFEYLRNYYLEVSYQKVDVRCEFVHLNGISAELSGDELPFELGRSMSSYGLGDESGDGWGLNRLIIESLYAARNRGIDVSAEKYDAVVVAHAGCGNESTIKWGDIWSAFLRISEETFGFEDGMVVPVKEENASPIGVTCHEFGHMLGLPDLYSTYTGEPETGYWCLMDLGTWVNRGKTPAALSAWCRSYLGWVKPKTVSYSLELSSLLPIQESPQDVYKLLFPGKDDEYLLIYYSCASEYSPGYPGEGILIWHVDEGEIDGTTFEERFGDNAVNNYSHPSITLIPADYSHPKYYPFGDSYDPWPGLKGNLKKPESYEGKSCEMNISNMSVKHGKASLSIMDVNAPSRVCIYDVLNYPNPAGKGYFHPEQSGGIITTFVFNFSQVSSDKELVIFNLAGEKVFKAAGSDITMNVGLSSSAHVVYEYKWNGKNASGDDVAPGAYFYAVKSGSAVKKGKMAVIR